jgi:chorismate synthase
VVRHQRNEADQVKIQAGTENGYTLGSPISLFVANQDQRPVDYSDMSKIPRPSHADYAYAAKYNIKSSSGGGRSSARETIGRVGAGAVAEKWLKLKGPRLARVVPLVVRVRVRVRVEC